MKTIKIANIQHNYCRLTGKSLTDYQHDLFEAGCLYAQLYYSYLGDDTTIKQYYKSMTQSKEYWRWFENQYHLQVKKAFIEVGIAPYEKSISLSDIDALRSSYAFSTDASTLVKDIYPNKSTRNEINQKQKAYETI